MSIIRSSGMSYYNWPWQHNKQSTAMMVQPIFNTKITEMQGGGGASGGEGRCKWETGEGEVQWMKRN